MWLEARNGHDSYHGSPNRGFWFVQALLFPRFLVPGVGGAGSTQV